jgi:hypothetical protein
MPYLQIRAELWLYYLLTVNASGRSSEKEKHSGVSLLMYLPPGMGAPQDTMNHRVLTGMERVQKSLKYSHRRCLWFTLQWVQS